MRKKKTISFTVRFPYNKCLERNMPTKICLLFLFVFSISSSSLNFISFFVLIMEIWLNDLSGYLICKICEI